MNRKYKFACALTVLTLALTGCASKGPKVEEPKPNPLPKLVNPQTLSSVFSTSVASTSEADPLRLRLDSNNGVVYVINPKGEVEAYQGKQRLWQKNVSKQGLSSGVEAAEGLVVVGNQKGQLFALDQATGEQKWTAQLSGAILAPSLIHAGRVITVANDGTVYAHELDTGKQAWTYSLPNVQFSLRGQAAPVALDARNVLIASANAYIYAIDALSGAPRLQRRMAVTEGRSDIQRLVDIDGEPTVAGQFLVTTSYQGQVTVMDMVSQQVIWSEDASSTQRPEVSGNGVFVAQNDGKITAYEITTGHKLWENDQLLNRKLSNPVMLGQNLVVGDLDGVLHLIDPSTGNIIGRAKTSGDVRTLRVIDNQLFVATRKGAMSIWQNR
ncbi:outer membrane protein assembly factor BamB [Acinetobacter cumulans]|jgi:outer membrane protein assembly factor BamB|uniref:Outer membrane protein assembly factor BamB n=1 Tax=Acinetobacter cumulans TaxID=2136182 RepID=A0A3A8GFD7_9GAMM|nr:MULTISPECIES: outer membrane protein assembly factor BamB [Acinetobacter]NWK73576.1 outer membrane protein assembly factor BamB [Acinetobacter sp. SwsAc6]QCO21255.1 outer membrane protein assembly factor BamB [Acinetobacter cumulans]RKG51792.1 outer membrane protein assembly factor BamB [Acinetobacter cumulans]RKG52461.1 outer membrane protein assembly factor BamB [Acinetobacter cumulans]RLL31296.1 outer membrane protein assembly factor BamB [Acinetobacter cumulans]